MNTRHLLWLAAFALPAMAQDAPQDAPPLFDVQAGLYAAGSVRELDSDYEATAQSFESLNSASNAFAQVRLNFAPVSFRAYYERGFRNDRAGIMPERARYLVVDSALGSLLLGDAPSAFRRAGERLDPFYDTALGGFNGRALEEGASYGLSNLTNSVTRNSVAYTSPVIFGGLQANLAGYAGTKDAPNDEVDRALGVAYTFENLGGEGNALMLGVQALQIENPTAFALGNSRLNRRSPVGGSPGRSDNYRVTAAYTTPRFSLGLSGEQIDVKAEPDARGYLYTSATFAATPRLRLAASYGRLEFKTGSPALSGNSYSVGAFARLAESATGYLAVRQTSLDTPGESTLVALGLSVSFKGTLYAAGGGGAGAADADAAEPSVE